MTGEQRTAFEPVIGLEVHIQLQTQSKIFCACAARFGEEANSQICPVCMGLPGALPAVNRKAVEYAARLALATGCRINPVSVFARKNYFYPDLPKGYQISQFEHPFAVDGEITIRHNGGAMRTVRIRRIHLEDDAGKSIHNEAFVSTDETLLDLNRCGVPLIELVTEPDLRSASEAAVFLQKLRQLVRYLGICSGNMEEGSLRCDANISLRPAGGLSLGARTEVKNMNSFRHVEHALAFEIERQRAILERQGRIESQTLFWDAERGITQPMRSKEEAHDYRYFPEPDLMPLRMDPAWIEEQGALVPELPEARENRYQAEYGLPAYDAAILTSDPAVADYFESLAGRVQDRKLASNWVMGEVLRASKERGCPVTGLKMTPEYLAELLNALSAGRILPKTARQIFDEILESGLSPADTIKRSEGAALIADDQLRAVIQTILDSHPEESAAWLSGKDKLGSYFTGLVLQSLHGRADPRRIQLLLQEERTKRITTL